jgi:hypothetical protein
VDIRLEIKAMNNWDAALKAESKKVVRHFQQYSSEQRANHSASSRLGYRQRQRVGEFFYTHPNIPNRAFTTRRQAAEAALRR